jgi:hypothetical protein
VLAAVVLPADGPVRRTPPDVVGFALMAPGLVVCCGGSSSRSRCPPRLRTRRRRLRLRRGRVHRESVAVAMSVLVDG